MLFFSFCNSRLWTTICRTSHPVLGPCYFHRTHGAIHGKLLLGPVSFVFSLRHFKTTSLGTHIFCLCMTIFLIIMQNVKIDKSGTTSGSRSFWPWKHCSSTSLRSFGDSSVGNLVRRNAKN